MALTVLLEHPRVQRHLGFCPQGLRLTDGIRCPSRCEERADRYDARAIEKNGFRGKYQSEHAERGSGDGPASSRAYPRGRQSFRVVTCATLEAGNLADSER